MAVSVTYIGPSRPGVWVPDADQECEHGKSIEVDEKLAKSLCEQADNWKRAGKRADKE